MKTLDEIHSILDSEDDNSVKQPKSHRRSRFWMYIGAFCVSLVLGMTFFFPVFNSKSGINLIRDFMSSDVERVEALGADDWLEVGSAELDRFCGEHSESYDLDDALDRAGNWYHGDAHVHWFILDLGQTYTIKKVHARSAQANGPTDVNIYVSDSKDDWGAAVGEGWNFHEICSSWSEFDTTDKDGRYLKVEIEGTAGGSPAAVYWGCNYQSSYYFFDVYGDVAAGDPPWSNVCPVASGEQPSNGSTGESLQRAVGCTISDSNSNHTMNVTFATNVSGGWINQQTNSSVGNNSAVNWTYNQANVESTKYWWRVFVHDGICNASFTFHYTTSANATTWQSVDNTYNGLFTNTTVWHVEDNTFNGIFTNITAWKIVDNTFNGAFTNVTKWLVMDNTFNGVFTNTTSWYIEDSSFNGMFTNTTVWHVEDNTFNGIFTNITAWKIVDNTFNGAFTNVTKWLVMDNTFNGVFMNTTVWFVEDNSINGVFTNSTSWRVEDDTFNGVFINTTTWQIVSNTFNGVFTNTTIWKSVDSTYNGVFTNVSSNWQVVNDSVNGVFTNTTSSWQVVCGNFNGRFINYTGNFTTTIIVKGGGGMASNTVFLFIGLVIGLVSSIGIIKRKRKGDKDEYQT